MSPHRRAWRWLSGHPWVTSLVMVVLVVGASGWVVADQAAKRAAFGTCVARWADETDARVQALREARRGLDGANDDLWRTMAMLLSAPTPTARDEFSRHLAAYVGASDAYQGQVNGTPSPVPPRLACG